MGMLVPFGTLVSVKLPSAAEVAIATGSPEGVEHWSQVGPWVMGSRVVLGT